MPIVHISCGFCAETFERAGARVGDLVLCPRCRSKVPAAAATGTAPQAATRPDAGAAAAQAQPAASGRRMVRLKHSCPWCHRRYDVELHACPRCGLNIGRARMKRNQRDEEGEDGGDSSGSRHGVLPGLVVYGALAFGLALLRSESTLLTVSLIAAVGLAIVALSWWWRSGRGAQG